MAAIGKLYTFKGNSRSTALYAVIKENNLPVEIVHTEPANGVSLDYKLLNKLGRVPTFEGADGYVLTECIAIAVYLTSQNEKTSLLGKTKQDYASILRWMSFTNSEILPNLGGWFRPLQGRDPYNKKNIDDSRARTLEAIKVLDEHFLVNTYFVGERVTLADLFGVGIVSRGFQYFFDKDFRAEYPNFPRWYETVANQDIVAKSDGAVPTSFIDTAVPIVPPKKEEKPKKEAAAPKPKAAPAAAAAAAAPEEEEDKPAPKPKHVLEALPRASWPLDEWKRQVSNNPIDVALKWFWDQVKENPAIKEEYSLWQIDFDQSSDKLVKDWNAANMITGLYDRLEQSRKYIYAGTNVWGKDDHSADQKFLVRGVALIRGQKHEPAFDVASNWESWLYKPLAWDAAETKEFTDVSWTGATLGYYDKAYNPTHSLTEGGHEYGYNDGKAFK